MTEISIIVPVYGAPQSLSELCARIDSSMQSSATTYEVLLVNDACPKGSWEVIKNLCEKNSNIKGINLARNFGQPYAQLAGLDLAKGNFIAFMDCDLQDRPESLNDLLKSCKSGNDVSIAKSKSPRDENALRELSSKLFYRVFSYLNDQKDFCPVCGQLTIVKRTVPQYGIWMEENFLILPRWELVHVC